MKGKQHPLKWFQARKGKFIYREPIRIKTRTGYIKCCDMCERTKIKVAGIDHAEYLFDCQNELGVFYQDKL